MSLAVSGYSSCTSRAALDETRASKRPYIAIIPTTIEREGGDDTGAFELEIKNTGGSPAVEPYLTVVRCDVELKCVLMTTGRVAGELGAGGVDTRRP